MRDQNNQDMKEEATTALKCAQTDADDALKSVGKAAPSSSQHRTFITPSNKT